MSGRFFRASKFRHVYGQPKKRDQYYDHVRVSKNAWDSNLLKVNTQYISVNWEAGGGGAFAVIPLAETGKLPDLIPLFRGHTAAVTDTDWNPFHDDIVASASEDGKVLLWKVPAGFSTRLEDDFSDVTPQGKLLGHSRKIGHVLFSPVAENVLASSSADYSIRFWDVSKEQSLLSLQHPDTVQSLSFSGNGSLLATTCRDKKVRVWDPRQQKAVAEGPGHGGAKNSRLVWLGEHDRLATTGFSKMSDRQLGLWNIHNLPDGPIGGFTQLDQSSGVCMPFWDDSTKCIYLAGKGDGNIRYYEYANDQFHVLSEYKSTDPTRGIAFMPKRGLDLQQNELMRAYRTVNDSYIEPLGFFAPRRSDLYPPAPSGDAAISAEDWYQGGDALPKTVDMETLYRERGGTAVATHFVSQTESPRPSPIESKPGKAPDASAPVLPKAAVKTDLDKFMVSVKVEDEKEDDDQRTGIASDWDIVPKQDAQGTSYGATSPVDATPVKVERPKPASEEPLPMAASSDATPLPKTAMESGDHTDEITSKLEKLVLERTTSLDALYEKKLEALQLQRQGQLQSRDAAIQKLEDRLANLENSIDEGKIRRLELELEALKGELGSLSTA